MGEGHTESELRGGEHAAEPRRPAEEPVSESGWVTTEVAAEALNVSPRTVRDYIANRKLEAKSEGEGVERRWLVSIDSVQAMREARRAAARLPRERREGLRGGEAAAKLPEELLLTVQELQYRLGWAEARAELTERTESTLREERDRLREENERLRGDLEAERSKGFWQRLFGA